MGVLTKYNDVLPDLASAILCTALFFMWSVSGRGACLSYTVCFVELNSLYCVLSTFWLSVVAWPANQFTISCKSIYFAPVYRILILTRPRKFHLMYSDSFLQCCTGIPAVLWQEKNDFKGLILLIVASNEVRAWLGLGKPMLAVPNCLLLIHELGNRL